MPERIDIPPTLQGDEKNQLQQVWSYLYQLSEAINNNLDAIGGNELTDSERKTMQQILQAAGVTQDGVSTNYETLKSLIIKTADFVQNSLQEYRMKLLGETVASGQFGRYVRQTGLDVEVTPEGIKQNYSLREIAEDLKHYEVNAKNYIKTGLLRTVGSIPVYGVAIGKDIVTFSQDGTETYNDGNKVAELTADELSFWQGGEKVAGYTGSKISFYYNGTEAFYIQNGKIYAAADLELGSGKKVKIDEWEFYNGGLSYKGANDNIGFQLGRLSSKKIDHCGIYYRYYESQDEDHLTYGEFKIYTAIRESDTMKFGIFYWGVAKRTDQTYYKYLSPYGSIDGGDAIESMLGTYGRRWTTAYIDHVIGNADSATKADKTDYIDCKYDSSLTNFNTMKTSGRWWVSLSGMTNKPSDISSGIAIVDVIKISDSIIYQKIMLDNKIYIRMLNSTWGSWYKFTGTAV